MQVRIAFYRFLAAYCVLVGIVASCRAAERPNIVWLISEDNSIHYMKMFDKHGAETPRIAELAAEGLQFNRAFSNAPVCSVARTTLMTGCFGPRIGTQYHRRSMVVPMPAGVKMFPAYLRAAGYYTSNNQKKDYNAEETEGTWDESSRKASWRKRQAGQPFFHMQSFTTTHESSLHFPQKVFETQPTQTDPSQVFVQPYFPDTELFRYTVARYHDNIQKVDAQIGSVVDQLKADGLLEDTFIFYFGDHGGVLPRGKGYAYESGLHVPLVVRVPKNFRHLSPWEVRSQINGFVQFVDFGPTVLKLAGVNPPAGIDGVPFLGDEVQAGNIEAGNEAFGYADRFDEKYDLVRTLRRGRFKYVRNYQPFNVDGLQNNYRYIMLAYREWRELFKQGKLDSVQSQFFLPRPAEQLFDLQADPHETQDLSAQPEHAGRLIALREELQKRVKSMPDLSFYPESYLAEHAFSNPVAFGQNHRAEIGRLVDTADLALLSFGEAKAQIQSAIQSTDPWQRYWGLIVCSSFGPEANSLLPEVRKLLEDPEPLVRVRAAEFCAIGSDQVSSEKVVATIKQALSDCASGIETNLILNSCVLLRDSFGLDLQIGYDDVTDSAREYQDVRRRLSYFDAKDQLPSDPRGQRKSQK